MNEKDNQAAEGWVEGRTKDTEGKEVFFVVHHVTSLTNNVI